MTPNGTPDEPVEAGGSAKADTSSAADDARDAQIRRRMAHLFRNAGDDVLMRALANAVVEHRTSER